MRSRRVLAHAVAALAGLAIAVAGQAPGAGAATIAVGPTCSLANALRSANDDVSIGGCVRDGAFGPDTIVLPPSTHALTAADHGTGSDLTGLPTITSDITIAGSGATISRTLGPSPPFFRIFDVAAPGHLRLKDVTVHGGRLQASGGVLHGGGIRVGNGARLTLDNAIVADNVVDVSRTVAGSGPGGIGEGGGIHVEGPTAQLTVTDSHVKNNQVLANGGDGGGPGGIVRGAGIYAVVDTTVAITGSVISGNALAANGKAGGSPGGIADGAGLYVTGFDKGTTGLMLTDVRVRLNTLDVNGAAGTSQGGPGGIGEGGGMYFDAFGGGSAVLTRVVVSDNAVRARGGAPGAGGGITRGAGAYLSSGGGSVSIADTSIDRNFAVTDGGGGGGSGGDAEGGGLHLAVFDDGTVTLDRVTFFQNSLSSRGTGGGNGGSALGGALAHSGGSVVDTLTNVTVANNAADASPSAPGTGGSAFGGGIFWSDGTITVQSSTLSGNAAVATGASAAGGGLAHGGADVRLASTIVAGNTASVGPDCRNTVTSLGHNLIGTTAGCTGVTAAPAATEAFAATDKFGPAGLGAFTEDGRPGHGHFPLLADSQAIDAGGAGCPSTDQLRQGRNGPCDIGAVERVPGTSLVAAVLPASRSVSLGGVATAFASIINLGTAVAFNAGIAPADPLDAHFTFQTTNPATNALTGSPNTGVDIPPGGTQSYVIALRPFAPIAPTEAAFDFAAVNGPAVDPVVGLNTLLLSATLGPVPDIVALAATLGDNGIVDLVATSAPRLAAEAVAGAFSVATVNVGAGGTITASPDTGNVPLPLAVSICQSNPITGECITAAGPSVTATIGPGQTPTFVIFAASAGSLTFDPAHNRIFVRFKDQAGTVRGATSVAVRTP